jgi:hypothetical protein
MAGYSKAELEEKMATALRHLEKGRALWNGPSHQCASVLREALGMGEQSAQNAASPWREQAKLGAITDTEVISALRAQNAELVAALDDIGMNAGGEASRRALAALAAAGHKQEGGK